VVGLRYGVVSKLGNRVAMVICLDSMILGLQIEVMTVLGSLADRFAQAPICTVIIGNTHGNASFDYHPATPAARNAWSRFR
jgi:hypothetical protein